VGSTYYYHDSDLKLQFVHPKDIVSAIITVLENDAKGTFNVASPNPITIQQLSKETNLKFKYCPPWLLQIILLFAWICCMTKSPILSSTSNNKTIVEPKRLEQELNFEFKYSSPEALFSDNETS